MPASFDPYHNCLGIAPNDQPPNHYRLLGIDLFEDDRDVIDTAATRVMSLLKVSSVGGAVVLTTNSSATLAQSAGLRV